jgi:hypothetical protein
MQTISDRRRENLTAGREQWLERVQQEKRDRAKQRASVVGHHQQHVSRRYIKLGELLAVTLVDRENYQRNLDLKKVQEIWDDFSWEKFDAISLNLRPPDEETKESRYALVDGQHRLAALEFIFDGRFEEPIPCDITHVQGVELEADIYLGKNLGRTKLSYEGSLRARMAAREERANILNTQVQAIGMSLRTSRKGITKGQLPVGQIAASRSLEKIMNAGGEIALKQVLALLHDAYGSDPNGYGAPIIEGTWEFLMRFHPVMDRAWLVKRLANARPEGLLKKAMDPYGTGDLVVVKVGAAHVGLAMHAIYNIGRHGENKLPDYIVDSSMVGNTTKRLINLWRQTYGVQLDERNRAR